MNMREFERQLAQRKTLESLGFTADEAAHLRRISMTLRRWHELECGTDAGNVSRSVERDGEEPDSKPYMRVQYPTAHGYVDRKWPIPDRETGALKRLAKILHACNERRFIDDALGAAYPNMQDLKFYIQGDPRGAALYIIRPGDVPEGEEVGAYYWRGICVY